LNSHSLATELTGALRNFNASLAIFGNLLLLVLQNCKDLLSPFKLSFKMKNTLVCTASPQFAHWFDIKLPAILNTVDWLHLLA